MASSEKKTVAFFDFVTTYGGAPRSTVLLCERLQEDVPLAVVDAYGVCERYVEALKQNGTATHVLMPEARHVVIGHKGNPRKQLGSLLRQLPELIVLRKRTVAKIRELNPDVIWTNSPKSLVFLASAAQLREYPLVFFARGWFQRHQISVLGRWAVRKNAAAVLTVSSATAHALQSWGVSPDKIHVVYDILDFDAIFAERDTGVQNVPPGADREFKILLPAGLLRTKGQHTAVEAAAILKQQDSNFALWLAGEVSVGDTSGYADYLQTLIHDNGLEDHVFLLGWRRDARALMHMSDVVILPTHTEGLPRVLMEAMILGRVVVSTLTGGIPDIVTDGETGLAFPVEDPAALAERLVYLRDHPDEAARLAHQGHEYACRKFGREEHIMRVRQAFDGVIRSRAQRR